MSVGKLSLMEHEEFESRLGNIAVCKDRVERDDVEDEKLQEVREDFSKDQFIDCLHFSKIEKIEFQEGGELPSIRLKLENGWKRMFFAPEDPAEECFKMLRYRWQSFRQNNG